MTSLKAETFRQRLRRQRTRRQRKRRTRRQCGGDENELDSVIGLPKTVAGENKTAKKRTVNICGEIGINNRFIIKDENKSTIYTVIGEWKSTLLKHRLYIFDSEHTFTEAELKAVVERKLTSVRGVFWGHYQVFCPNTDGETPYHIKLPNGNPVTVYRFATIEKQATSPILSKYNYTLYQSNGEKYSDPHMKAKRKITLMHRNFDIKNSDNQKIGEIRERNKMKAIFSFNTKNTYTLTVGRGNDLLACIIIALVADTVADRKLSQTLRAVGLATAATANVAKHVWGARPKISSSTRIMPDTSMGTRGDIDTMRENYNASALRNKADAAANVESMNERLEGFRATGDAINANNDMIDTVSNL